MCQNCNDENHKENSEERRGQIIAGNLNPQGDFTTWTPNPLEARELVSISAPGAEIDAAIEKAESSPDPEEEETSEPCLNCREKFDLNDLRSFGKDLYCDSCFDEIFTYCQKCEDTIEINDSETIEGPENFEGHYCRHCFDNKFSSCDRCDGIELCDNTYSCGNDVLCTSCYENDTTNCNGCGETFYSDEMSENDGEYYCESCIDRPGRRVDRNQFRHSETFARNTSRRFVGFELEFLFHKKDNEVKPEGPGIGILRDLEKYGEIHSDGSLNTDKTDFDSCAEFCAVPVNGDRLLDTIKNVGRIFDNYETGINESCGFHVHLDVSELHEHKRDNIFYWFQAIEKVFFGLVPPSRCENRYCESIQGRTPTRDTDNRYRTLNTAAYSKHGTFEVRLHSGTLNGVKVANWVKLLLAFFDTFQDIDATRARRAEVSALSNREKLIFLFQQVKIPLSLKKYLVRRIDRQNTRKKTTPAFKAAGLVHYGLNIDKPLNRPFNLLETAKRTITPLPPLPTTRARRNFFSRQIETFERIEAPAAIRTRPALFDTVDNENLDINLETFTLT